MLRILYIALLFIAFPSPSYAQDAAALCAILSDSDAASSPRAGAAYVAGVDVQGRPVAAADLGVAPSFLPDVIAIPMTIDLAEALGQTQDLPTGTQLEAGLGMIEIHKDGRVMFNGADLAAQTVHLCGQKKGALSTHEPLDKTLPLVHKEQPALSQAPVDDEKLSGLED